MDILVHKDGSATVLKVVKGDPILVQAATDVVQQSRFEPAVRNGWQIIERPTNVVIECNPKH